MHHSSDSSTTSDPEPLVVHSKFWDQPVNDLPLIVEVQNTVEELKWRIEEVFQSLSTRIKDLEDRTVQDESLDADFLVQAMQDVESIDAQYAEVDGLKSSANVDNEMSELYQSLHDVKNDVQKAVHNIRVDALEQELSSIATTHEVLPQADHMKFNAMPPPPPPDHMQYMPSDRIKYNATQPPAPQDHMNYSNTSHEILATAEYNATPPTDMKYISTSHEILTQADHIQYTAPPHEIPPAPADHLNYPPVHFATQPQDTGHYFHTGSRSHEWHAGEIQPLPQPQPLHTCQPHSWASTTVVSSPNYAKPTTFVKPPAYSKRSSSYAAPGTYARRSSSYAPQDRDHHRRDDRDAKFFPSRTRRNRARAGKNERLALKMAAASAAAEAAAAAAAAESSVASAKVQE